MALVEGLDNPLERLGLLPNTMNWRGGWSPTEQYYQNDVVVSPVNQASYILNGKTALVDGGDPTTNPDWIELSNTSTGVLDVQAGAGILLGGTQTIPVIINGGVRTIVPVIGGGIVVAGTPFNPTLSTTAIQTITAGDPFIGVNTIGTAVGITNEGVHTIDTGNTGISVDNTDPKNPLILNEGVLTIASAGTGITVNNGTGPNPTIQNDGVLELTQGTGGISITGTKANYTIGFNPALQPALSLLTIESQQSGPIPLQDFTASPFNSVATWVFTTIANKITTSISNGEPGAWVLDLSGFQFFNPNSSTQPPPVSFFQIAVQDGATEYQIDAINGGVMNIAGNSGSIVSPMLCNAGQVVIEPAVLKANGLFKIQIISFTNKTGFDMYYTSYPSVVPCYYYPNGIE